MPAARPMLQRLVLQNRSLAAVIVPQIGGGLARLDWLRGAQPAPLLRGLPADFTDVPQPGQLACFPLVPWSNRIAPSGFEYDGQRYVPTPNRPGEKVAIHGDGWQQAWDVQSLTFDSILLRLTRHAFAPLAYDATLRYTLDGDALIVELTVRNAGAVALPFGLGLHPWLPDPGGAQLQARADAVWLSGPDKLPSSRRAVPPVWDYRTFAPLPKEAVDNAFAGWDGVARVRWPGRGVGLSIEAAMDYFILYAPPGRDFFCFEPVDHPINAHNMPGYPGLTVLAPGASVSRSVIFRGESL
jgi:aldose 1-epimerase